MIGTLWLPQPASAPSPADIAAYLLQQRWKLERATSTWAVFSKSFDGTQIVLEVPQRAAASDYGRAVSLLIADLARIQSELAGLPNVSSSTLLRDIKASSLDIVRLSISGSATGDGRIPIEAGQRVFAAARDMLLAAACSVIEPRPVFAKRKPDEAMKLLSRARFGQTEVGSFVLSMECAIAPRLQTTLVSDDGDPDAPFERKTCLRLATALHAAEGATRAAAASARIDPFREQAAAGVSANLCDAIAEMIEATSADSLGASFSFASGRPLSGVVPRSTIFSADTFPILREAAARLRDEATYPASDVIGTVKKLESADPSRGGDVVLRIDLDGRMRHVRVSLGAADYAIAHAAHLKSAVVRCTGDLVRDGQSWALKGAREFREAAEGEET